MVVHRVEREEVGYKRLARLARSLNHSGGNTFHGENMRVTMFAEKELTYLTGLS